MLAWFVVGIRLEAVAQISFDGRSKPAIQNISMSFSSVTLTSSKWVPTIDQLQSVGMTSM